MFTGLTRQEQRALLLLLFIAVAGVTLHQLRGDPPQVDLIIDAETDEVLEGPMLFTGVEFSPIDINTASLTELLALPGIGEVKARSIVADRERNGPFQSVNDLTRVSGIGDGTVRRLEGLVTVGGATEPSPAPAPLISPTPTEPLPPAPVAAMGGININTANRTQLMTLPGIGEVRAGSIIADRERNGPFRSVQDLTRISGIGDGIVRRLEGLVTVGGAAEPSSAPPPSISPQPVQPRPPLPTVAVGRISINTANRTQLMSLPGIGEVLADRIIEHRRIHGPFRTVEGLLDVSRIGDRTLERLRPLVTL